MIISEKLYFKLVDGGWTGKCRLDILNDICVKYAKQFFGENFVGETNLNENLNNFDWSVKSEKILNLLQQNKTQEAEDYIWEHCKFNPLNKPN